MSLSLLHTHTQFFSVLKCGAVRCGALQCVAVPRMCDLGGVDEFSSVAHCGAVWCRVVQCGAVCCSVLQRVAACCSVLQRVSVYLFCGYTYGFLQMYADPLKYAALLRVRRALLRIYTFL